MVDQVGSFSGKPIYDSGNTIKEFQDSGLDISRFVGAANSYRCKIGENPGEGWLLMSRKDVETIDATAFHDLVLGAGSSRRTFQNLVFKQAYRLSSAPGRAHDKSALYLVEVTDKRFLARMTCINKSYNIRKDNCGGDEDQQIVESTKKSGTEWTWKEIAEDLWGEVGTSIVAAWSEPTHWPGSLAPAETPENISYHCISAWEALNDFVHRIGCQVRYDPTSDAFDIVQMGIGESTGPLLDDGGIGATIGAFPHDKTIIPSPNNLLEDAELYLGDLIFPSKVKICFPANRTDCDVDEFYDTPFHTIDVLASALTIGTRYTSLSSTAFAGSCVVLKDSMDALFDNSGSTTPTNNADLLTRAAEIADDYYRILVDDMNARLVYQGAESKIPGPFITEVTWRTVGDGLKTEVKRFRPDSARKVIKRPPGSNSMQIIRFEIVTANCVLKTATATVESRPCGKSIVTGEDSYRVVNLIDPIGDQLVGDPNDLVGLEGWAAYMEDDYDETCDWEIWKIECDANACIP